MDKYLYPFTTAIAWVWVSIHDLLMWLGMHDGSGFGWVLAIIVLTIVVRALIFPLYLRQIKSTRNMQAAQPELVKLQARYKGKTDTASRERMSREMQEIYKKHETSPYASCLPLLVQLPVLFALYRAIYAVEQIMDGTYYYDNLGPLDQAVAAEIDGSTVLGVRFAETFSSVDDVASKAIFIALIVMLVVLQFLTMRLSMKKNMPPSADPNNPMMKSTQSMMYVMPLMYIFTGLIFQMGLMMYMVTTTLWSFGQQLWVIKVMPTPGSPAYEDLVRKREAKYQSWGRAYFEQRDAEREEVVQSGDSEALAQFDAETLKEMSNNRHAKRVSTRLPEELTDAEKINVYRGLAVNDWERLPDDFWARGLRETHKRKAEHAENARRQPKRTTKAERRELAQAIDADSSAEEKRQAREARRSQAAKRPGATLTPEELEQRRQVRRQQERAKRAKRKPHHN